MRNKMACTANVSKELHDEFFAACKANNEVPSDVIKKYIEWYIAKTKNSMKGGIDA